MQPDEQAGYETKDVNVKWVAAVAAIVVLMMLLVLLSMAAMFKYFARQQVSADKKSGIASLVAPAAQFPEPRLQVDPHIDLVRLRAQEDAELSSYGWIDKKAGVVQIPIERAMDLIGQRGLPVRGANDQPGKTSLELIQERLFEERGTKTESGK